MRIEPGYVLSVRLPREVTADTVEDFDAKVMDCVLNDASGMGIDCSGLQYITSSHIALLWQVVTKSKDLDYCLQSPHAGLVRVLKTLDLYSLFTSNPPTSQPQSPQVGLVRTKVKERIFTDTFMVDEAGVAKTQARFMAFLSSVGVDDSTEFEVKTIYREVVAVMTTHGCTDREQPIILIASTSNAGLTMTFVNYGPPFNMREHAVDSHLGVLTKSSNPLSLRVTLIARLVERMSYERTGDNSNVHTLETRWIQ